MPNLDLRADWLTTVLRLLAVHLPDAEVIAYGSRVNGTSHDGSDLDLTARNPIDPGKPQQGLAGLREALSASKVPVLVQIHDWALIPESFRREILQGSMVVIQKGGGSS